MQTVSSQIEFTNLPPRTAPAPIEDVRELEGVLRGLLQAQTPHQIVETSQQIICAALRGEELHLLIGPPRLHIGRMNGCSRRTIMLSGEIVVKTLLCVLVDWNARGVQLFKEARSKETVTRQTHLCKIVSICCCVGWTELRPESDAKTMVSPTTYICVTPLHQCPGLTTMFLATSPISCTLSSHTDYAGQ